MNAALTELELATLKELIAGAKTAVRDYDQVLKEGGGEPELSFDCFDVEDLRDALKAFNKVWEKDG